MKKVIAVTNYDQAVKRRDELLDDYQAGLIAKSEISDLLELVDERIDHFAKFRK